MRKFICSRPRFCNHYKFFSCQLVKKLCYPYFMKSLPVGEFKAQFSEVLELVQQGESVGVLYGKDKKPVAKLVPMNERNQRRGANWEFGKER